MPQEKFTANHVLIRDAHAISTNDPDMGSLVSLDYDGTMHVYNLNKKNPDGSNAFPPIEQLTAGTIIEATYSRALGADPLVSTVLPELLSVRILGTVAQYNVTVRTNPVTSAELADVQAIIARIQNVLGNHGKVLGIQQAV
jgi:hypothetical protein